jgi:tetratricopeptide (TPR) repeat protein
VSRISVFRAVILGAGLTGLLAASAALAATDDRRTCSNNLQPDDARIAACGRAIASGQFKGKDLTGLYRVRAGIFDTKGDVDRSIADYDQAIRLGANDPPIELRIAYYFRAVGYEKKGDTVRAIADFSEAIRLDPSWSSAYHLRASAYQTNGDYDLAIADFGKEISLEPQQALNYDSRGLAYEAKGDYGNAIADYSEAVRLLPNAMNYSNRGIANLHAGSPAKALADLSQAYELALADQTAFTYDPTDRTYQALWLDIARRRNNQPSQLSSGLAQLDMTKWPAPVVRLFLGQLGPDAVLAAAADPDPRKAWQLCHAQLFIGEHALSRAAKEDAIRAFRSSVSACTKGERYWLYARAELKALGAGP